MGEPFRGLALIAGIGLAAVVVAIASRSGTATTYAGATPYAAAACAASVVALAGAAALSRSASQAAFATASMLAVTLPVWAGAADAPPAVRAVAEGTAPLAFALLLALAIGTAGRRNGAVAWLIAAIVAEAVIVVATRALLRDPFYDARCFADCLPSPFVVHRAQTLAAGVQLADGPLRVLLAGAVAIVLRGRARDVAGPALIAAGAAVSTVALAIDEQEVTTRPPLVLAYCLLALGATAIGLVVAGDAAATFLARRSALRLVGDLRAGTTRAQIEAALRRAAHDPALVVLDGAGAPAGTAVLPVVVGGRQVARIAHRPDARRALERALGPSARLALANAALRAQLEGRVEQLRAARGRIVALGDSARRGLERDLHDGAQQGVLAVLYELRIQAGRAPEPLAAALDDAASETVGILDELRDLAHGIHPAILGETGLRPALRALAATSPITVELAATPNRRYPEPAEATIYRLVDEAVFNAAQHAVADHVVVAVVERDGTLVATVADNGHGGAAIGEAGGLVELSDRVGMCGGSLALRSESGRGTTIEAVVPCA